MLAACGSGTGKAGSTTTSTRKTTSTGKTKGETTSTTTTETVTTLAGDDEGGGVEGCTESGGCVMYAFKSPDGQVFVCNELLIVRVRLVVKVPPPLSTSTGSGAATTDTSTATTEPTTTDEEQNVLRPECASGAAATPAVGVDIGDLGELQTSEDGESAWTKTRVRLFGHVEGGTFVASG